MSVRCALLAGLALLGGAFTSAAGTAKIAPNDTLVESFRGWGTSLCWWANVVGGFKNQAEFADAIFTDLRLTIVRYNIGGGENPAAPGLPTDPRARVPGFRPTREKWAPEADANQRLVLREAIRRGVKHVDAFANSPPWWMTASGSVTGGLLPLADNLKRSAEKEFADYLVEVMAHLTRADGIRFDTIAPMNEPLSPWWLGNRQEGCHMGIEQQIRVLGHLQAALETAKMPVGLVAPETFSTDDAIRALRQYPAAIRNRLRAVSTHGYDTQKRAELREAAGTTPVWISEHGDSDPSGMRTARAILDDLNVLRVEAWIYWQAVERTAEWGLIQNPLDGKSADCRRTAKFDVLRQFTNFVAPGSRIVATHDRDSVAALPPDGASLVVVALNSREAAEPFSADVSAVVPKDRAVRVVQTSPADRFAEKPATPLKNGRFETLLPPQSLTTFVVPLR